MKQFVKFTITLVMGIFALGFQSCGNDDKDEPKSPVDYNKVESIIGEWSCQAELIDGTEMSCDQFSMDFKADGTVVSHYSFSFTRSGSYTFNNGTAVCTFKNAYSEGNATVTMTFSEYNQGRAKVETIINYGDGLPTGKHTYLFYKLNQ